jgi:hypothetical protein
MAVLALLSACLLSTAKADTTPVPAPPITAGSSNFSKDGSGPSFILPPPEPEKQSRRSADTGIAGQKRVPTIVVGVFLVLVLAIVRAYMDRNKLR